MRMTPFQVRMAAFLAAALPLAAAAFNHTDTVVPIAPGKFTVACSNIEQNVSLIAAGASASDYWEGRNYHYITDILVNPASAVVFDAAVPNDRSLYVGHAGGTIPYAAIVCYPTPASNTDSNYVLPDTGDVIPHMQPAGAAPKIVSVAEYEATTGLTVDPTANVPMKLPMIVFSHGLTGSPISSGYVSVMVELAAHGFMVAGVFHGDPRFSLVRIEDLSDFVYLLANFDQVVELEMVRPLSLKVMLDVLLANPGYAVGIDTTRIGGFGASMGGAAMTFLAGAWATTTIGGHCAEPIHDFRIRAFAGYVPWGGYSFLPAYCNGQTGAAFVNLPYLAMSGTADTTAPLTQMKQAVNLFTNTRYMIELQGGKHELRPEDADELFTWLVTYFDTYLDVQSDPGAFGRLAKMNNVSGGGRVDTVTVDVHIPFPDKGSELTVWELYNTRIDHYYYTDNANEANTLAASPSTAWTITGNGFKAWPALSTDTPSTVVPVCRFDLAAHPGPGFAFFSASASDCSMLMSNRGWGYYGTVFYVQPVDVNLRCPDGYIGVNRAYNNGFVRNDSNHRYTTSDSLVRGMEPNGWLYEATVMCSRP